MGFSQFNFKSVLQYAWKLTVFLPITLSSCNNYFHSSLWLVGDASQRKKYLGSDVKGRLRGKGAGSLGLRMEAHDRQMERRG